MEKMRKISTTHLQSLELQNKHTRAASSQTPLLALDWGEKFCGLAWTPDGQVCFPVGIFTQKEIETVITKFVQEKSIQKIIVGLPISGNGTENHICKSIREFVKHSIHIDVSWVNERGSSQATVTPRKGRIDDLAALQILEQFLQKEDVQYSQQ